MLKKRLIGVVTIKNGWAVQSFGYKDYMPLGKPECLVENLSRWGVDEIIIQVIDRSKKRLGPDFKLLSKIAELGLDTPLIYGGGISSIEDAVEVIQSGADRLVLDSIIHDKPKIIYKLADHLGSQALIASMPMSYSKEDLLWLNYRDKKTTKISQDVYSLIKTGIISEVLLIDWKNEGKFNSFNNELKDLLKKNIDTPLIVFGGISHKDQLFELYRDPSISAVAIGNFLNYGEHKIQEYKNTLTDMPLRAAIYRDTI